MFRYLPLLLIGVALAVVALRAPAPADAAVVPLRMSTGGWIFDPIMLTDKQEKVTFGGVIQCDGSAPNNLIVQHRNQAEFRLETITSVSCTLNNPNDPNGGGRLQATGTGSCNGGPATALLIDLHDKNPDVVAAGRDTARFTVSGQGNPACNFAVFATALEGGNLVMHAQ
jgi:hypothetical protein